MFASLAVPSTLAPLMTLLLPVVRLSSAPYPNARLLEPVVLLNSASDPFAVL